MAREVVLRFLGDAGNLNRTFAAVEAQSARTMGRLSASTAGAASNMGASMSGAVAAMSAAGTRMRRTGGQLTRNVSLPLAVIGTLGVKTAIDYERSMNVLQAASGATGEQMAGMARLAKDLGADIKLPGTSAADAGEAMVELSKAGLSVADTMAAARGVLQLSAAGGLENAQAAEIAANALNAFGLKGDQATRVSDLLAGAANSASGEVTDMADALKMSAAVFGAAGVPIEDLVTSTALMAKAGIQGSDAGTSLKTMLMRLQDPASKEAAETMAQLGIDAYDAAGNLRPMRDIIGQVSGAMSKLTPEARAAAMASIFGADAVRAANVVLAGGVGAFDAMKGAVTREGAAADMATARTKGLGGAIDAIKSSLETLAINVIVPMLPKLTEFATKVAGIIGRFSELPAPVKTAALIFAGLLAVAGPLVFVFGALATAIGAVGVILLGPIGVIVALGAALVIAYNKFDGFRELLHLWAGDVKTAVSAVGTAFSAMASVVSGVFDSVVSGIKGAINTVIGIINAMIGAYNKLPFVKDIEKIGKIGEGGEKKAPVDPRAIGPTASGPLPGKVLASGAIGPAIGGPIGTASTASGTTVSQTNIYNGVSIEEATTRANADLGWRMGMMGRR